MGGGGSEIAPVLDVVAEIPQRFHDARGAQHGRPHRRAGHARARLDRRAEDGDRPSGRLALLPVPVGLAARLPAQDLPLRRTEAAPVLEDSRRRAGNPLKSPPSAAAMSERLLQWLSAGNFTGAPLMFSVRL